METMRLRRVEGGRGVSRTRSRTGVVPGTWPPMGWSMRGEQGDKGGEDASWASQTELKAPSECAVADEGREGCRGVGREGTSVGSGAESDSTDSMAGTRAWSRGREECSCGDRLGHR